MVRDLTYFAKTIFGKQERNPHETNKGKKRINRGKGLLNNCKGWGDFQNFGRPSCLV
jgi:hypothetical protein